MANDVNIKFSADISDLQRGMQQASAEIDAANRSLRNGATQMAASFGALSQAYANSVVQRARVTKDADESELAMARAQETSQFDIAMNGVKMQQAVLKQAAQMSQMNHQQELAGLLALENERESMELRHLQVLQSTYAENSTQYANMQRKIDELASQSALRRVQTEVAVNREIYNDYRRTFDQIGASVTNGIMGMIEGHESLRQAAQHVLLAMIQDFIQARIRMVADWLAGIATQNAATAAGEAAKTAAVTSGVAARTAAEQGGAAAGLAANAASMIRQIFASANETFAGVFGFLAPVMGPAAAGPAAAAQGAVMGMASFAQGSWALPSDMIAQVHQGEMIVPAAATPWAQSLLSNAAANGQGGGVTVNHATHFNIQALDSQDVKRWFKANGKTIMRTVNDAVRTGAHLGLSKLT
jgi:hypothetical protein